MTKFRALPGALATGTLLLAFTLSVYATVTENDIVGSQSKVDGSCVAPLPVFNGQNCTYNDTNPWMLPNLFWLGPISTAGYYEVGQSPFALDPSNVPTMTPPLPVIGDNKIEVPFLTNSIVTIDDNDTPCDTNDVIGARFILGAATRAFAGGPGTWGEETWGDGEIVYEFGMDPAPPRDRRCG